MHVTLIDSYIRTKRFNATTSSSLSLGLAYLAAYLRAKKIEVCVVDAVGEGIDTIKIYRRHYTHWGLEPAEVVARIPPQTDVIGISASHSCQHNSYMELLQMIKVGFPDTPVVFGGVHASAYHESLLRDGVDYIILGEGEESFYALCLALARRDVAALKAIDGLAYRHNGTYTVNPKTKYIQDIDALPFPARDLFPLDNYFKTRLVHSPVNFHHTPIISSRGCPHRCPYCSVGAFWKGLWRGRTPKSVLDEMEYCHRRWDIREFYFMDDDLTADKERARQICQEIIRRNLKITWYGSTGLRSENLDEEMLKIMKKSGCGLIALSPESGSMRVLTQLYAKEVDLQHIKNLVRCCHVINIRTILYFIIGCKGETPRDRQETLEYIMDLTKAGMDEMGIFVFITHPDTALTKKMYDNQFNVTRWEDMVQGTVPFSHSEYHRLKRYKFKLYLIFFIVQMLYHPGKILRLIKNFLLNKQETKFDRALAMMVKTMLFDVYLKRLGAVCLKPFQFFWQGAEYVLKIPFKIFFFFLVVLAHIPFLEQGVRALYVRLIELFYFLKIREEYCFRIRQKRLYKCKGVFPSDIAVTSAMIVNYLKSNAPLVKDKAVLDLGAGSGVIGLALDGYNSLELSDVDSAAIKNLYLNASDCHPYIRITRSDLFENIGRSFDTIIWNPPYFKRRGSKFIRSIHLKDKEMDEFFKQVSNHLRPEGRIIISYSSLADRGQLQESARKYGFDYTVKREKRLHFETLYVMEFYKK